MDWQVDWESITLTETEKLCRVHFQKKAEDQTTYQTIATVEFQTSGACQGETEAPDSIVATVPWQTVDETCESVCTSDIEGYSQTWEYARDDRGRTYRVPKYKRVPVIGSVYSPRWQRVVSTNDEEYYDPSKHPFRSVLIGAHTYHVRVEGGYTDLELLNKYKPDDRFVEGSCTEVRYDDGEAVIEQESRSSSNFLIGPVENTLRVRYTYRVCGTHGEGDFHDSEFYEEVRNRGTACVWKDGQRIYFLGELFYWENENWEYGTEFIDSPVRHRKHTIRYATAQEGEITYQQSPDDLTVNDVTASVRVQLF
jgi:hypothetical protein